MSLLLSRKNNGGHCLFLMRVFALIMEQLFNTFVTLLNTDSPSIYATRFSKSYNHKELLYLRNRFTSHEVYSSWAAFIMYSALLVG